MPTRIGINGFGRIGRQVTKAIVEKYKGKLQVVAINDLTDTATNAHLFKYDSNYGRYPGTVEAKDSSLVIDGEEMKVFSEPDPAKIPWGDVGAEIVIEGTGRFTRAEEAAKHMRDTVKKAIITAPARGDAFTIVLGVNDEMYDPKVHVVSNASCTTNATAPVVKVLHQSFGVRRGLMTTVHSYTNDQRILDVVHKDLRRARAAAVNIIPTSTGAARAVELVIPDLKGRLDGVAFRVPTSTVSVVDFVAELERDVTIEEVNAAFNEAASKPPLKGILEYTDEPLVSSDFKGHPASSIFDAKLTMVNNGSMVKAVAWYDNEWGFSVRVADLCAFLVDKGL